MINLQKIVKKFDQGKTILNDLNFEIPDEKFAVLVGPSGSGKSTLLRLISGLEQPTSGKIYIGDRDVTNIAPKNRNIGLVFQNYALYPHFTVFENLSYPLKIQSVAKSEIKKRVQNTAKLLEIEDLLHRYPKEISGGQKQRVAIGRCIVREPAVFLFDEPLSNIDVRLRENLRREIKNLHNRLGRTSIYVTHDQIEAMALGEVIVVLNDGKVQQIGSPQDIYQRPQNLFTAEFIGSPTINKIAGSGQGKLFQAKDGNISLAMPAKILAAKSPVAYACIRPDKIEITTKQHAKIKARLVYVEYLGSKSLLEFEVDALKILVEAKKADWQIDSSYGLEFEDKDFLWFDEGGDSLLN